MNRKEILRKAQAERSEMDEREQAVMGESFGMGGIAVMAACILFAVLRAVEGQHAYEFAAVAFAYLTGLHGHQYLRTRKRKNLILGAASAVMTALDLAAFFLTK